MNITSDQIPTVIGNRVVWTNVVYEMGEYDIAYDTQSNTFTATEGAGYDEDDNEVDGEPVDTFLLMRIIQNRKLLKVAEMHGCWFPHVYFVA